MNHLDKIPTKPARTGWLFACMILAGISFLPSCKKEPFEAAYFSLIDSDRNTYAKDLQVTPDGGVRTLLIVSNRNWSIDYDAAPWLTISPTSGKGVTYVSVNVAPNESLVEDIAYMNVTNNTLEVIKDFKITRQSYIGTYNGKSTITSPIEYICTTCVGPDETPSSVNATVLIENSVGKIKLTFSSVIQTGAATYYTMDIPFENVAMQTALTEGKTSFKFIGTGTFDMTGLGESLGDPAVAGVKNTYVEAQLAEGKFTTAVLIDPGTDHAVDPDKTTFFSFNGSK